MDAKIYFLFYLKHVLCTTYLKELQNKEVFSRQRMASDDTDKLFTSDH